MCSNEFPRVEVPSLDVVGNDAVLCPELCVEGIVKQLENSNWDRDNTSSIRDWSRTHLCILNPELLGRLRLDAVNVVFVMVINVRLRCIVTRNALRC